MPALLQQAGDLVDAVDEGEAAQLGELLVHGVEQRQGELGELDHRAGDVGEHVQVGLGGAHGPEGRVDRTLPDDSERARCGARPSGRAPQPALLGRPGGQLAGQGADGLAQLAELAGVGAEEVDVLELPLAVELGRPGGRRRWPPCGDAAARPAGGGSPRCGRASSSRPWRVAPSASSLSPWPWPAAGTARPGAGSGRGSSPDGWASRPQRSTARPARVRMAASSSWRRASSSAASRSPEGSGGVDPPPPPARRR